MHFYLTERAGVKSRTANTRNKDLIQVSLTGAETWADVSGNIHAALYTSNNLSKFDQHLYKIHLAGK